MKTHIIVFCSAMTIGVFLPSHHIFDEKADSQESVSLSSERDVNTPKTIPGVVFSDRILQLESHQKQSNEKMASMEATLSNAIEAVNAMARQFEQINTVHPTDHANNENPRDDFLIREQEMLEAEKYDTFFDDLEETMLMEDSESEWAKEMRYSLSSISEKLASTKVMDAKVTAQECKESTCRLEISHNRKPENTHLLPAFIAAPESRQVYLKHINENGLDKTIAIYKR